MGLGQNRRSYLKNLSSLDFSSPRYIKSYCSYVANIWQLPDSWSLIRQIYFDHIFLKKQKQKQKQKKKEKKKEKYYEVFKNERIKLTSCIYSNGSWSWLLDKRTSITSGGNSCDLLNITSNIWVALPIHNNYQLVIGWQ